ncbi:type III restriction/modification system, restriction subunit [Campylobacter blaseri]|uniref:Type III restriction-modification system endonuclease n=1 Tax=Campylobacter blaseri TaxID=2042961 RepID=A0A2P8QZT3_9BACT|nr:type III restriction-modification system endonuclease [Campylobacter blaseri]PSM51759.1 type III restriction-modification system endonuclease [Campylobacter blaseri]PSM53550.1 type III restriction-modification system endonuclease [Campylobacter blaseri]QKF86357.1 type III restriction/modification system, restriction subunit [Campylobacter blaseri]
MKGFNFEKNLPHQTQAVNNTIAVFENLEINKPEQINKNCVNPILDKNINFQYFNNIRNIQELNGIEPFRDNNSNIIDIMMETGTGKTYTYTKTIFELNRYFGIFKFIVVVPTLSIKAGTIDFLKSDSQREHFKEQYGKSIELHIVESQKTSKNKKLNMPTAVSSFVTAENFGNKTIQVMIINAGMVNSDTMQKRFDRMLFDNYNTPFGGIASVNPFVIIDEPHKFSKDNKTWKNIEKMKPQFILRYGATFEKYENLIYTLSAVDSFNRNLVKGVIGHIAEFEDGKNAIVKLVNTDGKEATFELTEGNKKSSVKIAKKESLQKVHSKMSGLLVENLNKSKVLLSNGLQMSKGDKINPYSYAQTLQEVMIKKAIRNHFKIEKEFLTRDVKIKPLTLFFIDNIEEYRGENGYIKKLLEEEIKAQVENLLKTETNSFYKSYLEKTLSDISKTHGGYFSKDNTEKDEAIEQEVIEILHDKQLMLNLNNTRRFIFSKWTLREGWDNPNVFQICKLRSSGSEISKLQEVGRGLRLPVNEYGNRVKDEQFYLNYFVDFTESDFVESLVNEINEKSGAISIEKEPEKFTCDIIKKICEIYKTDEESLLEMLDEKNLITRSNNFKNGGWEYIKKNYPLIFDGIGSNKIRKTTDTKKKIAIRTQKYQDLKELWEKLNEKVILEYKFKNEDEFKTLLVKFFNSEKEMFLIKGIKEKKSKILFKDKKAIIDDEISVLDSDITPISTMKYSDFVLELSKALNVNLKTINLSILESKIKINQFLNTSTIRIIKQKFNDYLLFNAFNKYEISYQKVSNSIHPTKLTDKNGKVLEEILATDVGVMFDDEDVAKNYLFEELYYDSELEKQNIQENIKEVVVFTKIPKNSIKIPIVGGKSYSPDFAYVLTFENGKKQLNFIVETKNVLDEDALRKEEIQKIKHAEVFFNGDIKIKFRTQFSNDKINELIKEIIKS